MSLMRRARAPTCWACRPTEGVGAADAEAAGGQILGTGPQEMR